MPAAIDEHPRFLDESGKPLVNGKAYYGKVNQDPRLNPEPIWADSNLTIPIANPQILDAFGQTLNKVYVGGRYSFRLENSAGSQIRQDFDRGQSVDATSISLTNIQGTNDITGEANPTIQAYKDKQQYTFTTINENTGPVTLSIDGQPATPIKNQGIDISAGDFSAGEIVVVAYNVISDRFELIGGGGLDLAGIIVLWFSSIASIPVGWAWCDGNNGTPDYRNFFLVGGGDLYPVGSQGGGFVTGAYTLAIVDTPSHAHPYNHGRNVGLDSGPDSPVFSSLLGANTGAIGGGGSHAHPQSLPPYKAAVFMMKL